MQIWCAVAALLVIFIIFAWFFLPELIYYTCAILHFLWGLLDWGPFHPWATPRYDLLARTANNSAHVGFGEWVSVIERTIGILNVLLIPIAVAALWSWYRHPAQVRFTRRPLDITSLPHALAPLSPALTPVLAEGDRRRLLHGRKDRTSRLALTPEQFVEQNGLLRHMQLDVAGARRCFMAQLGRPLTSWKSLAAHEKALFAVFGLQYFLEDRRAAVELMNALNRSCQVRSRRDGGEGTVPVYSLAGPAFRRVIQSEGARQWLKQHSHTRTGLVWLYGHDLRLPPPNWLWLKGVDRTLFYALHRANTTKGFIEGAGVVAVARAEAEAIRLGLPCPEPCVDEATEGLRRDLLSLGLIWDEPQPDRERRRRVQTNWSLTDDVLPRRAADDPEF